MVEGIVWRGIVVKRHGARSSVHLGRPEIRN